MQKISPMGKFFLVVGFIICEMIQVSGQKLYPVHCVELGGGFGYYKSLSYDANLGFSGSLNKYFAALGDYNLMFIPGDVLCHEFSVKIGPYFSFFENSFVAMGAGVSLFTGDWNDGQDPNRLPSEALTTEVTTLMIPLQMKINLGFSDKFGVGVKGTYNQSLKSGIQPRASLLLFLSYSLKGSS